MKQQCRYNETELDFIESSLHTYSKGCASNTAGTAYLFEIDHLKATHLKLQKLDGQDARRLEPHHCKNHFIDNTNLHDFGGKGNAPITAFSLDQGKTWRSGIAIVVTPRIVLIQPIIFDHQRDIKDKSFELDTLELKPLNVAREHWRKTGNIKKSITIRYLNKANLTSMVDGKIKCSPDGPDTVKVDELSLNVSTKKRINSIMASQEYKFFTNLTETPGDRKEQEKKRPKHNRHNFSRHHKSANILHVPPLASVVERKSKGDKLFVAEYLDWPTTEVPKGMRMMAYLEYDDVKTLVSFGKVSRQKWHTELLIRTKGNFLRHVYDVPRDGCFTLVEASSNVPIRLYNDEGEGVYLILSYTHLCWVLACVPFPLMLFNVQALFTPMKEMNCPYVNGKLEMILN